MSVSKALGPLLALATLLPSIAHADPKDDARRHFAAGLQAAQGENFEVALQRFLAAQQAFPHPATLYNIAKSYTDLDDLPNALTYYRLFRDASPQAAGEVDPIIAVLEARLGQSVPVAGAGPVRVVGSSMAGPTAEELARLQGIAAELEALTAALQRRGEEVEVVPSPDATGPDGGPTAVPELPDLDDGGFLADAYERVVVTASRVGQDPLDSPSTVSVLTADDILLSGVTNVPDLLRRVAGVDAMSLTSAHTDVSIRGFNQKLSNKVLVLVDGRSTYMDFLGTSMWSSFPIQLEEIERIEVIRGPGSAVYGANAVTGVINIITRTPGEGQQVVRVDGGAPGLGRASGVTTGRIGGTAYRLSAGYEQLGRWAKETDLSGGPDSPSVETYFDNDDQALRVLRANARLDRTISPDVAVSVRGGLSESTSEFYPVGALPNYGLLMRHSYLRGDLFLKGIHLRSFWNSNSGETGPWVRYLDDGGSLDAQFANNVVDVEVETPLRFDTGSVKHTLNVGAGYRYKGVRFTYLNRGFDNLIVEQHGKGFINEQLSVGPFGAVASLRVDLHPLLPITETLSPRGALLLRVLPKTSLRATAGSAYRAPNSVESYMNLRLPTPVDGVFVTDLGNRDLRPERINTFELGIHDESTFLHTADVVVYLNTVSDLIFLDDVTRGFAAFDPVGNGIEVGTTGWVNLPPTYTGVGVEADVELFPTDGVDLFANVNLSQITETVGNESQRDGATSTIKANAGASYRTPFRTDLNLTMHYLSPQEWRLRSFDPTTLEIVADPQQVPARLLASARIGVRPFPNEDLEIAGTLWNIAALITGNGSIEHPIGQPVSGRAFGSISYRF